MINGFDNISQVLVDALRKENIINPTEVQAKVIPLILENKDLIVQSQTGSGKTLAYLLPLFERLKQAKKDMNTLIIVPTHELAVQIQRQIERLSENSGSQISGAVIVGNVNILRQIEKLKEKPQIIVGTSGRILELIKKKKISAHTIKTIVIDEADKMMDKNNLENAVSVIKTTLKDRQILLFSASISDDTIKNAKKLMKDAEVVTIGDEISVPETIEHIYFIAEQRDKIEILRKIARILNPQRAMIFINQAEEIELATDKLNYHKMPTENIHGANVKLDRKRTMEDFKTGKLQFLIASDIAARGLHIDEISCIFNVTMPQNAMEYLHRVGRTGRNGNKGLAVSIVTLKEYSLIKSYEKALNITLAGKRMYEGKIFDMRNKL